jgi:hypothetical protein
MDGVAGSTGLSRDYDTDWIAEVALDRQIKSQTYQKIKFRTVSRLAPECGSTFDVVMLKWRGDRFVVA